MKNIFLLFTLAFCSSSLGVMEAQIVKDPLLDYYRRIGTNDFYRENSASDFAYSPQSRVRFFEADFTGSKRKSFFITDSGQYLNYHAYYGWAIYVPVDADGYRMVTDESTLIAAGPNGPPYVGYIDQVKSYGLIIGRKDSVTAYYLSKDIIQTTDLEQKRGRPNAEQYPKYFHDKPDDRDIITYTLAQLAHKYANSPTSK